MAEQPLTDSDLCRRSEEAESLLAAITEAYVSKKEWDNHYSDLKERLVAICEGDNFKGEKVSLTYSTPSLKPDWERIVGYLVELAGYQTWQGALDANNVSLDRFMIRGTSRVTLRVKP